MEAKGTVEYFLNQQQLGILAAMQTQVEGAAIETQLDSMADRPVERFTPRVIDPRYAPVQTFGHFSNQVPLPPDAEALAKAAVDLRTHMDRLLHSLKTAERGGKLAVQRYASLVRELQRILAEAGDWQAKSQSLMAEYWELADVEGVKNDVELKMVLRELQRAAPYNSGAAFAQAITLMRLGEYEIALQRFNALVSFPPTRLLATAARAEVYARLGNSRDAANDLRSVMPAGRSDARVRMHRARAFAVAGDLKQAEKEWEAVLKLGGHNIAAYRAIALINASLPNQTDRTRSRALDSARLATQLASDDWSCELAFALASVACGEPDQGQKSASRASDLTVGSNQVLCSQVVHQIETGQPVSWDF
ncbi:MAG: hypothetical protein Aurels2KO_06440 [Aureliella sp.]